MWREREREREEGALEVAREGPPGRRDGSRAPAERLISPLKRRLLILGQRSVCLPGSLAAWRQAT